MYQSYPSNTPSTIPVPSQQFIHSNINSAIHTNPISTSTYTSQSLYHSTSSGSGVSIQSDHDSNSSSIGLCSNINTTQHASLYNNTSKSSSQCESCRIRKRKCDGVHPSCGSCDRYQSTCSYEKCSKKRGPKPGQIKRLRDTINALKHEINHQHTLNKSRSSSAISSSSPMSAIPNAAVPISSNTVNGKKQRINTTQQYNQSTAFSTSKVLDSWLDQPNNTTSVQSPALNDSYQLSPLQLNTNVSSSVEYLTSQHNLSRNSTSVNLYFSRLNPLLPILSRNEFTYDKVRVINNGSLVDYSFMLRYASVIALGSTLDGEREYGVSAMNVARSMAGKLIDDASSDNARGFLLLALHCIGQRLYQQASVHVAVAKRMCCLQGTICPQELPMVCDYLSSLLNNQDVDTSVQNHSYNNNNNTIDNKLHSQSTSLSPESLNLPISTTHVSALRNPSVVTSNDFNYSFPRTSSFNYINTTTNDINDYGEYNGVNFTLSQLGLSYNDNGSALDADLPLLSDVNTLPLDHSNLTQAHLLSASNYLGLRSPLPFNDTTSQTNEIQSSLSTPQKPITSQSINNYDLSRSISWTIVQ